MNRRDFIQATMVAIGSAAGPCTIAEAVREPRSHPGFDRFAGWKGRRFAASGFFRLEHADRWWFVTPEGHAYLSFSINHLHPHWWRAHYNLSHWSAKLGVDPSDYAQFELALVDYLVEEIKSIGFNGLGLHTSIDDMGSIEPLVPYIKQVRFVDIPGWGGVEYDQGYVDVYAGSFDDHCDRLARETIRPLSRSPFLIGYGMTDIPVLTEQDLLHNARWTGRREASVNSPTWPTVLRNLGAGAPAKRRYLELMHSIYGGDIGGFNATYATDFASFGELLEAQNWSNFGLSRNDNERRDNLVFLRDIVDRYYSTMTRAIRRYDANHLIFGDKLNAVDGSADGVLDVISRYTDLVFYQIYDDYDIHAAWLDKWSGKIGKPFYNGDSSFVVATNMMPNPVGTIVENRDELVRRTREFFRLAFARKDFVGWGWCGIIDTLSIMPEKRYHQHQGIMDHLGNPRVGIQNAFTDLASRLYEIGSRGNDG